MGIHSQGVSRNHKADGTARYSRLSWTGFSCQPGWQRGTDPSLFGADSDFL